MTKTRSLKSREVTNSGVQRVSEHVYAHSNGKQGGTAAELTFCFCQRKVDEFSTDSLKCFTCKKHVHFTCTELPKYQIELFLRTSRKYMCERCVFNSIGNSCLDLCRDIPVEVCETAVQDCDEENKHSQDGRATTTGRPLMHSSCGDFLLELRSDTANIKDQLAKINKTLSSLTQNQTAQVNSVFTSKETQTGAENELRQQTNTQTQHATYADAVKDGLTSKITPTAKVPDSNKNQKPQKGNGKSGEKQEHDKRRKQEGRHFNHDVIDNSVKVSNTRRNTKFSQTEVNISTKKHADHQHADPDLPTVWAFHDSVLKKINSQRLGDAYGFDLTMTKTYTIGEAKKELTKDFHETPDAIILHVGINDLQKDTAENCSTALVDLVKTTCETFKKSKVVVSRVAPTNMPQLKAKADLFNAYNASKLLTNKRVSFISHENIKIDSQRIQPDLIHLTDRGTSVLAGNIGRHIHYLFWEKIELKSRRRRPQSRLHSNRHSQYHRWDYQPYNPVFTPWVYY